MKTYYCKNQKGFTLLEILLVIALIAILAGIVIVAINPAKQTSDARNTQRLVDVNTILNAVYQYSIDNSGVMPTGILSDTACPGSGNNEICKTGTTCTGLVDLSVLTNNSKYIVSIPFDPKNSTTNGTAYKIIKTADNRITVCAPSAENSATISVTR
jgi:type IV pilus assembly protein PilA